MLTGGKLADRYGRRRLFIIGLIVFTGASLACGLATDINFLIGARIVQGVGAAIMNPATLSIITATFPPRQRGMAIGIWAGVSAMALAIGPLVGGALTEYAHWSWIFFINVPVGILGIVVTRWAVDESRDTSQEQRLDLPGLLTSGLGLFALTYGLIEANNYGWTSPRIVALFVLSVVFLAAFVLLEQRQRLPMLDLSLFRNRSYTGANVAMLLDHARDVRDLLLQLALLPEHPRLQPHADGRDLPADDRADHPRGAAGRPPVRPDRLALADRRGVEPGDAVAAPVRAARPELELLERAPRASSPAGSGWRWR